MTIPGGKPENKPTFVPMSPVTTVAPSLVKAPTAVNNAKLDVVPKSGACAKSISDTEKIITIVRK